MNQFLKKTADFICKIDKNYGSIVVMLEGFIIILVLLASLLIYFFVNAIQSKPPLV